MKRLLVFLFAFGAGLVAPASAASYQYWGYWLAVDGKWEFSNLGAGSVPVKDGQVQGWRFAITGIQAADDARPRIDPDFETICASSPAVAGKVRVGLVIDYGVEPASGSNDLPPQPVAECAYANAGAPSSTLIADRNRNDNGFICAIDNWPTSGCGEAVVDSANENDAPVWLTTALSFLLLAVAWRALFIQRRR